MFENRQVLTFLFIGLFLLPAPHTASAFQNPDTDNYLGISLTEEESEEISDQRLRQLESAGVTVMEVSYSSPELMPELLRDSGMLIFVRQHRLFDTPFRILERDSLYLQKDLETIRLYGEVFAERFTAFAPFSYPDDFSAGGRQQLARYLQTLATESENGPPLYYLTAYTDPDPSYNLGHAFRSVRLQNSEAATLPAQVIHFSPNESNESSLTGLLDILRLSLERDQSLVVMPYRWLAAQLDRYEWLEELLKTYRSDRLVLSLEPDVPKETLSLNPEVLLLILLLGTYLLHFRLSPVYREAAFRYFTSRKYFVEQILEYRMRTLIPGTVLFLQHLILFAAGLFIILRSVISPLGLEALTHHFPLLSSLGGGMLSIFGAGLIFAFLIQFTSLIWMHLGNFKQRFSQTLALYCWPLQLNLLTLFLMTVFYQAGLSDTWVVWSGLLFLIIWVFSFQVASFDISKSLTRFRYIYLFGTIGLHLILLLFFLMLLTYHPPVSEALRLAFRLM